MQKLTVITPTTGKPGLNKLINSIDSQNFNNDIYHLLLWDDFRDELAESPEVYNGVNRFSLVAPPGTGRNGSAPGSMLRAIGLTLANTPWVTFADDDVWWEPDHYASISSHMSTSNWITTFRRIWTNSGINLGVDRFESVGDDATRTVPYEMCDGNTMTFKREYGLFAARFYRETKEYNDDRLMYAFLKENAGERGRHPNPTINHICPSSLEHFFRLNCEPVKL